MKLLALIILFGVFACTSRHNSTVITLDLSNRNLTAIPDSVFSFNQLQYLELGNRFSLYPPLSALGKDTMENMNKINTIPNEIRRLQHLRTLGFCFNDLKSLPTEIISLVNLDTLDISFNQNLKIATELDILKRMQWLKYLNIIATNADDYAIDELRKMLPKTKIDAKLGDIKIDTIKTSE